MNTFPILASVSCAFYPIPAILVQAAFRLFKTHALFIGAFIAYPITVRHCNSKPCIIISFALNIKNYPIKVLVFHNNNILPVHAKQKRILVRSN